MIIFRNVKAGLNLCGALLWMITSQPLQNIKRHEATKKIQPCQGKTAHGFQEELAKETQVKIFVIYVFEHFFCFESRREKALCIIL